MALLIDGYNLLHVTDIFAGPGESTELHRTRMALLDFLSNSIDRRERKHTTIVFDAAGAPPGLPHTLTHAGMTIHFARRQSDADELIEELLEACLAPRALTVVSSDHRVQRAARRRGAGFVDSDRWYADLRAARRQHVAVAEEKLPEPAGESASEDTAYWLKQFADAASFEADDSPFPAGYGDDLQDDA